MSLDSGNRLKASIYLNENLTESNGFQDSNDKLKLGFVRDNDTYDKDLNNYNFAKIEETLSNISNQSWLKTQLLDLIYPVGSIYMSTNNISPATFLGGNWERIAEGKCLFGIGGTQDDDKKPLITAAGDGHAYAFEHKHLAEHSHNIDLQTASSGSHSHTPSNQDYQFITNTPKTSTVSSVIVKQDKDGANRTPVVSKNINGLDFAGIDNTNTTGQHQHNIQGTIKGENILTSYISQIEGDRQNNNYKTGNLPPYIGVYMWKRTAQEVN